jgi:hypothetical protein
MKMPAFTWIATACSLAMTVGWRVKKKGNPEKTVKTGFPIKN